ncbi:MAG: tetratricopeptide repeat protein [Acidobacteria bacterium]|nr:tetratricopeptide repeat protein [Acidobacteriota bacterium]
MKKITTRGLTLITMLLLMSTPWVCLAQTDGEDIVIGQYRVVHSDILDEDRPLYIHLPEEYEDTQLRYPVLYLLWVDLYNYFTDATMVTEKLGRTGEIPPVIIVGVANTNRYRDLLPVRTGPRRESGGADTFLQCLEQEIIPFIDRTYRTNDFRILAGPQAAAVFSLHALISRPELFQAIICENPFMNPENAKVLFPRAETFFKETATLPNYLYIGCETNERPADLDYARRLAALLQDHKPAGFRFTLDLQEPSGYFIAPLPLRDSLRALFPGHKPPDDFQAALAADVQEYYERLSVEYGFTVNPPEHILAFEGDKLGQRRLVREAMALFEYQLTLYPRSLNALWRLGELCRGLGEFEKARDYYKQFLAIRDTDAAMIRQRLGQVERIIDASAAYRVERAIRNDGLAAGLNTFREIRADTDSGLYIDEAEFNALGYRLLAEDRTANALAIFQLNTELHPASANAHDSLAEAYMKSGDNENAVAHYRKSLALNPENANAREMLKKLEKK